MRSEGAKQSTIDEFVDKIAQDRNLPLSRRRTLAAQYTKRPVFFSWDAPKTREGFYHYRAGLPAATKRAKEFASYADLLWLETADPSVAKAVGFAGEIRDQFPGKQLVYNLSPSFNWMGQGFDEASLKSFIWDLAKHGYDHSMFQFRDIMLIGDQLCPSTDFFSWTTFNSYYHCRAVERF